MKWGLCSKESFVSLTLFTPGKTQEATTTLEIWRSQRKREEDYYRVRV